MNNKTLPEPDAKWRAKVDEALEQILLAYPLYDKSVPYFKDTVDENRRLIEELKRLGDPTWKPADPPANSPMATLQTVGVLALLTIFAGIGIYLSDHPLGTLGSKVWLATLWAALCAVVFDALVYFFVRDDSDDSESEKEGTTR